MPGTAALNRSGREQGTQEWGQLTSKCGLGVNSDVYGGRGPGDLDLGVGAGAVLSVRGRGERAVLGLYVGLIVTVEAVLARACSSQCSEIIVKRMRKDRR